MAEGIQGKHLWFVSMCLVDMKVEYAQNSFLMMCRILALWWILQLSMTTTL
jgi:hypothetical protein